MEEIRQEKNLRQKLILVGLKELEEHGIKDFSLRRVAFSAEVSCAAPYRHFKNKDELIVAILEYIKEDWYILCKQMEQVFNENYKELIKEICLSCVKFWIANGNFLSVLFLIQSSTNEQIKKVLRDFDKPILCAIDCYGQKFHVDENSLNLLKHSLPSLTYGSIMLITKNSSKTEELIISLKNILDNTL